MRTLLLAGVAALGWVGAAKADVLFQSDPNTASGFADYRAAGSTAVGRMTVSSAATIAGIGVLDYLPSAANLKFFIANASSGALLYLSSSQAFAADTGGATVANLNYKVSSALSFTFQPGTTYAVGSIADGATYTYADFSQTNTNSVFTSLLYNANVSNYANPVLATSTNCCSIGFELLSANATAVPEPASLALLGMSVVGIVAARRRREG